MRGVTTQRETSAVSLAPPTSAGERSRQATILLVEDERFVREAAAQILEAAGYVVVRARNGREARRWLYNHGEGAQLLLTDVVLPGVNGWELARELSAAYPKMKTIFISGYAENAIKRQETTTAPYLSKPFTQEALTDMVKAVLREEPRCAEIRVPAPCNE